MRRPWRRLRLLALLLALLASGAPAVAQAPPDPDPLEPLNRAIFEFNRVVDGLILAPAADLYGRIVPARGREGVRNFLDNLRMPVVIANALLQGDTERTGVALGRFLTNTILGLGFFDVATEAGIPRVREDFGQTLGVWGLGNGPYLVLPLLGPSTLRDAGGLVVDIFVFDPVTTVLPVGVDVSTPVTVGRAATDAVDTRWRLREEIDDLFTRTLDPYVTARTVYLQQRAAAIRNSAPDAAAQESYDAIFKEDDLDE
jgi:phospholipid-binding lipoprotein MlaA